MATGLEVVEVRSNKREKIYSVAGKTGYIKEFFSKILNRELGISTGKKEGKFGKHTKNGRHSLQ